MVQCAWTFPLGQSYIIPNPSPALLVPGTLSENSKDLLGTGSQGGRKSKFPEKYNHHLRARFYYLEHGTCLTF